MDLLFWSSLAAGLGLSAVHILAGKLRGVEAISRSWWLSFAGGVSVAYVFVHILPELDEPQDILVRAVNLDLGLLEHPFYLIALVGLITFYTLERAALNSRRRNVDKGLDDQTGRAMYGLHIASFAVYNALIGHLLHHLPNSTIQGLGLFFLAMALHFIINDVGLHEHHKDSYTKSGRWILSGAILVGWLFGYLLDPIEWLVGMLFAFLSGGVILNVLKEELPEQKESQLLPFLIGVTAYTGLLLFL